MSLLEVMISIAILLVMMVIVYAVLDSMLNARGILGESDETTRAARVTVDKLRRELQLAYLTQHSEALNTFRTVFVGVDDNPDKLYFASRAHQRLYRDSRECDETEITVWTEDLRDRGPGMALFHREAPRIDEKPDEGGVILPLAYHVRTFNLRYLDPMTDEWRDDWDTRSVDTSARLPRAVEIGLVLVEDQWNGSRKETIEVPFVTTVDLAYADPLKPDNYQPIPPDPNNPAGGGGTGGVPPGQFNPGSNPLGGVGGLGPGSGFGGGGLGGRPRGGGK
jgi:general secretion pathway protein J